MTATSMADAYPSEESGWRRWLLPLVVLVIVVAQAGILALVALNDQNTSRFGPETGPDIPLVAGAVFLISLLTAMPALLAIGFIATERNRAEAAAITEARHHGWHESIGEIRSWYADVFARGRYTVPVSLATATMAVAWGALYVETLDWGRSERTVFELIQPASAAFLGSYFFASWFLVKRYIGGDLGPQTYLHVAIRTWMAVMLALALQVVFSAASSGTLAVVAFVGGVVPSSMYEIVSDYALEAVGRLTTRQSRSSARITSIEGIDVWKEARLSEEGVDNIQNLAMEDPTRLTVVTREGWLRILDWVDQAMLQTCCDDWQKLKARGIRSASDLNLLFADHGLSVNQEGFKSVKDPPDDLNTGIPPDVLANLMRTIGNHPNFQRVVSMRLTAVEAAGRATHSGQLRALEEAGGENDRGTTVGSG